MHDVLDVGRMLQILAVDTRLRIIAMLQEQALCVGALAARLDVTQGAVSQHLRILREAGLVTAERRGYFTHYRLNAKALARWRARIDGFLDGGPPRRRETKGAKSCAAGRTPVRNRRN